MRVYTPESAVLHPSQLIREMCQDLWACRELAWRLFVRDISARYRQSALGYIWALLPPIATTLTFIVLNRSGIITTEKSHIPYPAFLMTGILLWQLFADAVSSPIKSVSASKAMLTKINFPREALLLSGILEVIFNFTIRAALLIPVFVYYKITLPTTAPLVLAGIVAILCLGFMIGTLLAPIGVLYADVGQALALGLSFWMLFTPVVYSPPSNGTLAVVAKYNPVSPLIIATRDWLTVGPSGQFWPSVCVFFATVGLLIVGGVVYRITMPILIERMGG
jgi:lipopolysaccharide transport system permease protein